MTTKSVLVIPFLKQGDREIVQFIAIPEKFSGESVAKQALANAFLKYQQECGRGYSTYYADNPYCAVIIHGL